MKKFVAGAAGTLMVASSLMAGAGSASASAPRPAASRPVVSVAHFGGKDTVTLTAVAGPKGTIRVTLTLDVTAAQARDPWVVQAFRTEIDPVIGAQACGCGLFTATPVFKGRGLMRTFKETSVVQRFIGSDGLFDINGFVIFVTDTKTGVSSGEVDINRVPLRR